MTQNWVRSGDQPVDEVQPVGPRQFKSSLSAMGKVLAPRSRKAIISHAFPCRVAELHVEVGHPVEAGDALVTLACHEVGAAMSEFYKARADLELATINLEREKRYWPTVLLKV